MRIFGFRCYCLLFSYNLVLLSVACVHKCESFFFLSKNFSSRFCFVWIHSHFHSFKTFVYLLDVWIIKQKNSFPFTVIAKCCFFHFFPCCLIGSKWAKRKEKSTPKIISARYCLFLLFLLRQFGTSTSSLVCWLVRSFVPFVTFVQRFTAAHLPKCKQHQWMLSSIQFSNVMKKRKRKFQQFCTTKRIFLSLFLHCFNSFCPLRFSTCILYICFLNF